MSKSNLYRGKEIELDNKFVYGSLVTDGNGDPAIVEAGILKNIIPGTDGQFIEICDSSGTKIFEGDKYQVANNIIYEVVYCSSDNSYNEEWIYCCFALLDRSKNTTIPFDEYAVKNGKVIGNVHENKKCTNKTFRQIWNKTISDANKVQNFRKNHLVECKVDIK